MFNITVTRSDFRLSSKCFLLSRFICCASLLPVFLKLNVAMGQAPFRKEVPPLPTPRMTSQKGGPASASSSPSCHPNNLFPNAAPLPRAPTSLHKRYGGKGTSTERLSCSYRVSASVAFYRFNGTNGMIEMHSTGTL